MCLRVADSFFRCEERVRLCVFFSRCCERFLDNAAETRHVVFRPLSEDTDRRLWQNRLCQEAPTCAYHCVATRRTSPWNLHAEQETCEHRGAATGFRARQCLLTHAHTTPRFEVWDPCSRNWATNPRDWNCCLDPSTFSAPSVVPDETVTSGDPCRCPRMALSSSGALPRTSGSLCVQSGTNSSKFFLLKAILSMDSTQSRLLRDLQRGVREVYWKRHSMR